MSLASAIELPGAMPGISPDIYGKADFAAVASIVHAEAGIVLPAGKAMLVYSRLAPLVRNTASGTFALYLNKVRADPAERARMLAMAQAGAHTIAQDEATCTVFGMPRAAISLGAAQVIAPIGRIARHALRTAA